MFQCDQSDPDDVERIQLEGVEKIPAIIESFANKLEVNAVLRQLPEAFYPALELTDLFAEHTGSGHGSKVMAELCRVADETFLNVYLKPSSARNREFYSRFGFETSKNNMMVRFSPIPAYITNEYPEYARKNVKP